MLTTTGEQRRRRRRRPSGRCVRAERSLSLCGKRLDRAQHRRKEEVRSLRPAAMRRVEALPRSQPLANNIVAVKVAGAYLRIGDIRHAESGLSALSVGERKRRNAESSCEERSR